MTDPTDFLGRAADAASNYTPPFAPSDADTFYSREIERLQQEITRLTSVLEDARGEAVEDAAKVADKFHWKAGDDPELIASAIRALVKP